MFSSFARKALAACRVGVVVTMLALLPQADLRADTTFNNGTTTISTGTNFGTNLVVGDTGTARLRVVAGGDAAAGIGTVTVTSGTWFNVNLRHSRR